MQKTIVIIFVLLYCSSNISAQEQPVNQPDQFVFYEVIETDTSSIVGLLYHNAMTWAKFTVNKLVTTDSLQGFIHAKNDFPVYKESGVLKKVSGRVSYEVNIEVKNRRYRYHFYNFIFHYYGPDRYHNIVPTGKKKELKEPEAPGWQKLWNKHRSTTTDQILSDIAALKAKIIEKPLPPKQMHIAEPKKEVKWD